MSKQPAIPTILDQVLRRFGAPEGARTVLRRPPVDVFTFGRPGAPRTIVTHGLSLRPDVVGRRAELALHLDLTDELIESAADAVARAGMATAVQSKDAQVRPGHLFSCPAALAPTGFVGLMVAPALFLPEARRVMLHMACVEVDILWLVPVFANELAYAKRHGVEGFMTRASVERLPLTRVDREPMRAAIEPAKERKDFVQLTCNRRYNQSLRSYHFAGVWAN